MSLAKKLAKLPQVVFFLQIVKSVFSIDFRTLGALRIATGLVLFVDIIVRATDLTAHYTDLGAFPREKVFFDEKISPYPMSFLSLHLMSGHWSVMAVLFLLQGIAAFSLLVGYRTRLTTVLSWVLWISLLARNAAVLQASDHLLKLVLFWGMFLPWGARWSVDAHLVKSPNRLPVKFFGIATVGYMLQICSVYWFSVLWKYGPEWRVSFTATYYALSLDQFATPLGQWLLQRKTWLAPMTVAALVLESAGPFLLLVPYFRGAVRTAALFSLMGMHVGYGLCLALGNFSWICCTGLVGFFPTEWWDWIESKVKVDRKSIVWQNTIRASENIVSRLPRPPRPHFKLEGWETAVGAIAVVAGATWNIVGLPFHQMSIPASVRAPASVLHVDQHWGMFAPFPFKDDGWFIIDGKLRNQQRVDLFRGGRALDYSKPKDITYEYANGRWRKYMMNLWEQRNQNTISYYAQYMCREWNANHPYEEQAEEFEIVFMRETTLPDYEVPVPMKVSLWKHYCFQVPKKS